MLRESQPEVGEWPAKAPESPGLSVAFDLRSGAPLPRAHIIILPIDDWTTIPAIVDQGVGTLNALAAALMEHDWWYFWWD